MVGRETLTNAVALNSASFNLGRMIGPAVAGGVIALLGSGVGASGWVILLNSATYLAVLVAAEADAQRGAAPGRRRCRGPRGSCATASPTSGRGRTSCS